MSTEPDNADGVRVTRSQRKRLTSVDSRPGTPVISKLVTLPGTTASPRRSTRRNSTSTPNGTPVKATRNVSLHLPTPEPKTPIRQMRGSSLSINDEEPKILKSAQKQHIFNDLVEEEEDIFEKSPKNKNEIPKHVEELTMSAENDEAEKANTSLALEPSALKAKVLLPKMILSSSASKTLKTLNSKQEIENLQRVTRSQSKSPQAIEIQNSTLHKSPKEEKHKSPKAFHEVIGLSTEDDERSDIPEIKGRTVKMNDTIEPMDVDEPLHMEMLNVDDEEDSINNSLPLTSNASMVKESNEEAVKTTQNPIENFKKEEEASESIAENLKETNVIDSVDSPKKTLAPEGTSESAPIENIKNSVASKPVELQQTNELDPNKKSEVLGETATENLSESIINVIKEKEEIIEHFAPNTINQLINSDEAFEPTIIAENKCRSVTFNEVSKEDSLKIAYPKTPGRLKSKSFFQVSITSENAETSLGFDKNDEENSKVEVSGSEDQKMAKADVNKTPNISKFKLRNAQSSTPIMKSDEQIVTSTVNEPAKSTPNAAAKDKKENSPAKSTVAVMRYSKLWNQNAIGTLTDKIDTIEAIKAKSLISESDIIARFSSDNESEDDDDNEEEEFGKAYEKSELIENEAKFVDNYESGDSLDSEERKHIEENEIVDNGESVGSMEDSDEPDEEYERDSFVVSDSDFDDKDLVDADEEKTKKPKRKRIILHSSDESDSIVVDKSAENNDYPMEKQNIIDDKNLENRRSSKDGNLDGVNTIGKVRKSNNFSNSSSDVNKLKTDDSEGNKKLVDSSDSFNSDQSNDSSENKNENENSASAFNRSVEPEVDVGHDSFGRLDDQPSFGRRGRNSLDQATAKSQMMQFMSAGKRKSNQLNSSPLALTNDTDKAVDIVSSKMKNSDGFDNKNVEENEKNVEDLKESAVHKRKVYRESVCHGQGVDLSDDTLQLAQLSHLQKLFNPLQKSKRQSLYSPSNAEDEHEKQDIKSSHRIRRQTVAQLSSNDFSPSQSLVDIVNEPQCELQRLCPKRKRLSQSFCGSSDNLVQDIAENHVHKKCKIVGGIEDNVEGDNEEKDSTSDENEQKEHEEHIALTEVEEPLAKATSCEYNKVKSIMKRCDDILEEANRAKLAQKLYDKQKKNNVAKQCKAPNKELRAAEAIALESVKHKPPNVPTAKKELKRLKKQKVALREAVKAAKQMFIGPPISKPNAFEKKMKQKRVKLETPQPSAELASAPSNRSKKWIHDSVSSFTSSASSSTRSTASPSSPNSSDEENRHQQRILGRVKTSAGYFIEGMITPKKKRTYIEEIHLPTGTVRVEPASPTLGLFRDEPITPQCSAGQSKRHKLRGHKADRDSSGGHGKHATERWRVGNMASGRWEHSKRTTANATETAIKFKQRALKEKRIPREDVQHRRERQHFHKKF